MKLAETLGFSPVPGTGNVSAALPMFRSVTVFGLSVLSVPTFELPKLKLGGVAKFSSSPTSPDPRHRGFRSRPPPRPGNLEAAAKRGNATGGSTAWGNHFTAVAVSPT